jgi:hypothetical protein
MRFDPTRRLDRRLPGGGLIDEELALERLFKREVADARPDPVPARDKASLRMVVRRNTTHVATCQPNAPLLIRIVRYPYRLDPARGSRKKYLDEWEKLTRVDWSAEVASALAERVRLRFTSGGRGRPMPFAVRPSSWALLPPDTGDDR